MLQATAAFIVERLLTDRHFRNQSALETEDGGSGAVPSLHVRER